MMNSDSFSLDLSNTEKELLVEQLLGVKANPYTEPDSFINEIARTISVPESIRSFSTWFKSAQPEDTPFVFGRNSPVDPNLPRLDWENPVEAKYLSKTTYVVEGYLTLVAQALCFPVIGHRSVNNGDYFHDIAPKKSLSAQQSQKTLGTLKFHKDFTNHFAVPDFVLQVVLRNDTVNEVYSTYSSNKSVIKSLNKEALEILAKPAFFTPIDDISRRSVGTLLQEASNHPVWLGEFGLKVFEGRTVGLNNEAQSALDELLSLVHKLKVSHQPSPGDFILIRNHYSLHGKEVGKITDPIALQHRWIMKTHNVSCIQRFKDFFEENSSAVVAG